MQTTDIACDWGQARQPARRLPKPAKSADAVSAIFLLVGLLPKPDGRSVRSALKPPVGVCFFTACAEEFFILPTYSTRREKY